MSQTLQEKIAEAQGKAPEIKLTEEEKANLAKPEDLKVSATDAPVTAQEKPAASGSYPILKTNMYLNTKGVRIKEKEGALYPANEAEKEICEHFVEIGYLKRA